MKKLTLIMALLGLFVVIAGCDAPPSSPPAYVYCGVEMLENGTFETGVAGWSSVQAEGQTCEWSSEAAATGSYSAKITSGVSVNSFTRWYQVINTNILVGERLKLKAKIKTNNIDGYGIAIEIRADDTDPPTGISEMYVTTANKFTITGTKDWTEYQVELTDPISLNIKSITAFLTLSPNTTGTVYFDDVSLIH